MRLPTSLLSRAAPQPAWQLPAAPTTWRRIRDEMGPVRRFVVPVVGVVAAAAALTAGAWWLPRATDPQRIARQAPDGLVKLQPWLGGQTLAVPAGSGIWAWRQGRVHLVALRAQADGPARVINLCERRTGAKHDPYSIYPLAVVGELRKWSGDRRIARTPLVVSASQAIGMPMFVVGGRAPDRLEDIQLNLQTDPAKATTAGQWQVAMASSIAGPGSGSYSMQQEAWLLWDPMPSHAAKAMAEAGPIRYSRAIQVRWQMLNDCDAGGLHWQLFDAAGASSRVQDGPATLWALHEDEPLGGTASLRLSVSAGRLVVPQYLGDPMEDKALFDAARQVGLIQTTSGQRISIAPVDLFRAEGVARMPDELAGTQEHRAHETLARRATLLKTLYGSANGSFVRAQVEAANQARHWLALSVHEEDIDLIGPPTGWRAHALGELLAIDGRGLPDVQARLFASWPMRWGPWLRLGAPQAWSLPQAGSGDEEKHSPRAFVTQLRLPLRPQVPQALQRPLRLLLLGRVEGLEGGTLTQVNPACLGPGCPMPELLTEVVIRPEPGARELVLHLHPQNQFNALRASSSEQMRVQWEPTADARMEPVWKATAGSGRPAQAPAEVRIETQSGKALFEADRLTADAAQLGMLPVLGLGGRHSQGLIGMLGRLGTRHGTPVANATLTVEPRYQLLLHQILQCMGAQGGDWVVGESRCAARSSGAEHIDPRREAHAVILGAENGEIVAVASGARLADAALDRLRPGQPYAEQLLAFERFNPGSSPLKPGAWVHYGGSTQGPGSTFKVPQALALEHKAASQPAVRAAVEGLSMAALDEQARRSGHAFASSGARYPAPCPASANAARRPYVENFGSPAATAGRYAEQGRLGLVQALRNSINTWFAFTGEWIDGAAALGHADAQALGKTALASERPIQAVLTQLGWEQRWLLDGGLLPDDFDWQPQDVLRTTASVADPFVDKHSVRQQAIGMRLQTTPLAMASAAAAVATGRVVKPRLLAALNARPAHDDRGPVLGMPLTRVRAGLSAVVTSGTASSAFSAPALKEVKPLVFGKTGSAPLGNRPESFSCKAIALVDAAPLACQNSAWFIGYLQPGAVPGENRPLAFAVQITRTRMLGGGLAAPVIARWLEAIRADQGGRALPAHAEAASRSRPTS